MNEDLIPIVVDSVSKWRIIEGEQAQQFLLWWFQEGRDEYRLREKYSCPSWWKRLPKKPREIILQKLKDEEKYNIDLAVRLQLDMLDWERIDLEDSAAFLLWWFNKGKAKTNHVQKRQCPLWWERLSITQQDIIIDLINQKDKYDEAIVDGIQKRIEPWLKISNLESSN